MGAGALEETPLGTYYKCKLVVSVRLDLADLSNKVNNCAPSQIARQFATDEAIKKVFMVLTNMFVHLMSISPVRKRYCSSLLIASGHSAGNAPNELLSSVYTVFRLVAAERVVSSHHTSAKERLRRAEQSCTVPGPRPCKNLATI